MMPSETASARRELNARYLPAQVGALLLSQLFFPFKGWMFLLVGCGLARILTYMWTRSLEKGLELTREVRHGWVPALCFEVAENSDLPGYRTARVTGARARLLIHRFEGAACRRRDPDMSEPAGLQTADPVAPDICALECPKI